MNKLLPLLGLAAIALTSHSLAAADDGALEAAWDHPPPEARLRAYWWWLNSNVTNESITHDLEEMRDKGFGGAVIFDADGSGQDGNTRVPAGPAFFSPAWRELYKHTLREADRLGLEMSLNIQSGWNLGGPVVKAEDAAKKLVWSETKIQGPAGAALTPADAAAQRCLVPGPLRSRGENHPEPSASSAYTQSGRKGAPPGRWAPPRRTPRSCSRTFPPRRATKTRQPARWSMSRRTSARTGRCTGTRRRATGGCCGSDAPSATTRAFPRPAPGGTATRWMFTT